MSTIKAMEPGEPPVIRGKVSEALLFLWADGRMIASEEIPAKSIPFQTNNLSAWFKASAKVLGALMRPMLGYDLLSDNYRILVNDGEGPKQGRGSNENEFSFELMQNGVSTYKLLIKISTIPHQKLYAQRMQKGDHTPRKRLDWKKITYWDLAQGKVFQYRDDMGEHLAWDPEEYWKEFPTHKGQIPVKQAH